MVLKKVWSPESLVQIVEGTQFKHQCRGCGLWFVKTTRIYYTLHLCAKCTFELAEHLLNEVLNSD